MKQKKKLKILTATHNGQSKDNHWQRTLLQQKRHLYHTAQGLYPTSKTGGIIEKSWVLEYLIESVSSRHARTTELVKSHFCLSLHNTNKIPPLNNAMVMTAGSTTFKWETMGTAMILEEGQSIWFMGLATSLSALLQCIVACARIYREH